MSIRTPERQIRAQRFSVSQVTKRIAKQFALLGGVAIVTAGITLVDSPVTQAQSSVDKLNPSYKNGEIFTVPKTDIRFKLDIAGFELTHDRQITEKDLVTVGNAKQKVVLKVTYDTLFEDVEPIAKEYEKLWWYFYTQEKSLDIGRRREWVDGKRFWSTHSIETSYGVAVNEKHYDMFVLEGSHYFHLSTKRPMYLEGDSTYMLKVMNSFEFLPLVDSVGATDSAE